MVTSVHDSRLEGLPSLPVNDSIVYCHDMANRSNSRSHYSGKKSEGVYLPVWFLTIIISGVATIVMLLAGWYFTSHIPTQISNQLAPLDKKIALIELKIELALRIPSALKELSENNADDFESNLKSIEELMIQAKKNNVVVEPDLIAQTGQRLLEYNTEHTNTVWGTVAQLASYRSYLNYKLYPTPGLDNTQLGSAMTIAPGSWKLIQNSAIGKATQVLDWGIWRNCTFRDCIIVYKGGPIVLEGAVFENCSFQIANNMGGEKLIKEILVSRAPHVEIA